MLLLRTFLFCVGAFQSVAINHVTANAEQTHTRSNANVAKSLIVEPSVTSGHSPADKVSTPQASKTGATKTEGYEGIQKLRYFGQLPAAPPVLISFIALAGLLYALITFQLSVATVQLVEPESNAALASRKDVDIDFPENEDSPENAALVSEPEEDKTNTAIVEDMIKVSNAIADGAQAFMIAEFTVLAPVVIIMAAALGAALIPQKCYMAAVAFILGAFASACAGYIGMRLAVYANVRCTYQTWHSLGAGFDLALYAGSVMGFALVSIGVASFLATLYLMMVLTPRSDGADDHQSAEHAMCGFGLGASFVALFARVGGGIFTKAADVGADLSGKNEYGLNEDDPRNPACIADNVGDNVGDIAGMGADLFGSFAEASVAAVYIWKSYASDVSTGGTNEVAKCTMYPLMVSAGGIVAGLLTMLIARAMPSVEKESDVEARLKAILIISTLLMTMMVFVVGHVFLPHQFNMKTVNQGETPITDLQISACVLCGLWAGMGIGLITEYYTSHSYAPVRETAEAYRRSASTGLILGYALGFKSVVIPLILIIATIVITMHMAGPFGIAMAGIGMLGTLSIALTIDAYGPIADNAGGIAEMSGMPKEVRNRTDCLDAAGNTTAAIGKGFAIGSAALVGMALYLCFVLAAHQGQSQTFLLEVLNQYTLMGLFVGSMLPFLFSAMLMTSVAHAADAMLEECFRQFPGIVNDNAEPDYQTCIKIATRASLSEMMMPGLLVICCPIVGGLAFGTNFVAGLLMGILLSGSMLAIAMSNSGGAYDNAKKYIEAGGVGPDHRKGSQTHKNAVVGDTLGDPLKDTSGPALNILIKLSAVTSLTIAPLLEAYSYPNGEPKWLSTPAATGTASTATR